MSHDLKFVIFSFKEQQCFKNLNHVYDIFFSLFYIPKVTFQDTSNNSRGGSLQPLFQGLDT